MENPKQWRGEKAEELKAIADRGERRKKLDEIKASDEYKISKDSKRNNSEHGASAGKEPVLHTIERNGVEISYEERYEEFDNATQEKFGIKGIRRKVVTQAPEDFWKKYSHYQELFHDLTEGEFPSFSTWNHAMHGDGGDPYRGSYRWKKHVDEGEYFQTIDGRERTAKGKIMKEKYRDADGVFNMDTIVSGEGCWRDSENSPVFVFGSRNKRFKDYLNQIDEHPEVQKMLKRAGWSFSPKLILGEKVAWSAPTEKLVDRDSWIIKNTPYVYQVRPGGKPEVDIDILKLRMEEMKDRPEELANAYWALLGDKNVAISYLEEDLGKRGSRYAYVGGKLIPMYLELGKYTEAENMLRKILHEQKGYEIATKTSGVLERDGVVKAVEFYISEYEKIHAKSDIDRRPPSFEEVYNGYNGIWPYHFDNVRFLAEGIPRTHGPHETVIPSVTHPAINPLRWCYADMEMLKNDDGKLEIRFFETV
jgi:hypothetical protein